MLELHRACKLEQEFTPLFTKLLEEQSREVDSPDELDGQIRADASMVHRGAKWLSRPNWRGLAEQLGSISA